MRSSEDPEFSDICDRVKVGRLLEKDIKYLKSRVIPCQSELLNENFKLGKLCIIVTTNDKKDLINNQKLEELLPHEQSFDCNSMDWAVNLPVGNTVPEKMKDNASKTGNLQTQLKLKVGAPVYITCNHAKKKYREDGLMNGARGYVQAIQTSRENPSIVDVVWVVFNNEKIGNLYRFEHNHLRKDFNPGHKMAVPILPTRSRFKAKFGDVEYQRQNFALSLSYAITAHKCQGWTLEEIIIDFGSEPSLKNYILSGSFYVALTRVRKGNKVFLRSFDPSYIQVNKKIEEKVNAMIKYRSYEFKKIYLDEDIFEHQVKEWKIGYLNINGLLDGNHATYFNSDKNLLNLDLVVLAETKLTCEVKNSIVESELTNWNILKRFDASKSVKHMGLLALAKDEMMANIEDIHHYNVANAGILKLQALIVSLKCGRSVGFLYCRSTPSSSDIARIKEIFIDCNAYMGDLNLSHRIEGDKTKLRMLCGDSKISVLNEITRSISNNQLDYILINRDLQEHCFSTAFYNFISDHKTITLRLGTFENKLNQRTIERITFDKEYHLRSKLEKKVSFESRLQVEECQSESEKTNNSDISEDFEHFEEFGFARKFLNADGVSCWLNSCLQLILAALDRIEDYSLSSNLGRELLKMRDSTASSLHSSIIKDIIITTEDSRVATKISLLTSSSKEQKNQWNKH